MQTPDARQKHNLEVTHSGIKRILDEKLNQPPITILAAIMSTLDKMNFALAGDST